MEKNLKKKSIRKTSKNKQLDNKLDDKSDNKLDDNLDNKLDDKLDIKDMLIYEDTDDDELPVTIIKQKSSKKIKDYEYIDDTESK